MCALAKHIRQLVPLAKNARYLPLHVYKLTVDIGFVAGIRRASSLGRGSRRHTLTMLSGSDSHLVRCRRALPLPNQVIVVRGAWMVHLHLLLHVLNASINSVVLFLPVGGTTGTNILDLASAGALKVTALFIEVLKHVYD